MNKEFNFAPEVHLNLLLINLKWELEDLKPLLKWIEILQ